MNQVVTLIALIALLSGLFIELLKEEEAFVETIGLVLQFIRFF